MLLSIEDLKPGMVIANGGIVEEVTVNYDRWTIMPSDYWLDYEEGGMLVTAGEKVDVTHVLGHQLKPGMVLRGGREVLSAHNEIGMFGANIVRVLTFGTAQCFSRDGLVELRSGREPVTIWVDPKKHLDWAVQAKDWAQARAALEELEKQE